MSAEAPRPWTIARIIHGAPWFVAAELMGDAGRVSWTSDEGAALRFDGATALTLHQAVSGRERVCCYVAREGHGCIESFHPEGHT